MQQQTPYTQILLTVEPNRFILEPFDGPLHIDDLPDISKDKANPKELLQILFRVHGDEIEKAEGAEQKLKEEKPGVNAPASISLLGHVQGQQHRVSIVAPGIVKRPVSLIDNLHHGC